MTKKRSGRYKYDVFISHASEDKETFVRQFAAELMRYGARVWYDEFALKPGDSLSGSIDKGLARSRFGIVVLSKAFLRKAWPDYELRGLVARQVGHRKVILPIWHQVHQEDIVEYSPSLADKVALNTDQGLTAVVIQVLAEVRPDLYKELAFKARWWSQQRDGVIRTIPVSEIRSGPRLRERHTHAQMIRIRILCELLAETETNSFEEVYDSFRRDLNVETELQIVESLALAVYLYHKRKPSTPQVLRNIFGYLAGDAHELLGAPPGKAMQKWGVDINLLKEILDEIRRHPAIPDD